MKTPYTKGFSLVEMLIYIALIAMMFVFIVQTMLSFVGSYKNLIVLRAIDQTGLTAMERITRDIRNATGVTTGSSTFNSSSGALTIIETTSGVSTTTRFYLQSGLVKLDVNNVYQGPLTVNGTTVTSLMFRQSTSTVSQAIRIDMTVTGTSGSVTKTRSFHSTIILKGS